jgi:hypothetical protein
MKLVTLRKGLFLVSLGSVLALGCELIVDFDRTLIPIEGTEGGLDGSLPETSVPDAPVDAPADAADAEPEAGDGGGDAEAGDAAKDG